MVKKTSLLCIIIKICWWLKEHFQENFPVVHYYQNLLLVKGTFSRELPCLCIIIKICWWLKEHFQENFPVVHYYQNLLLVKGTFSRELPCLSALLS